MSAQQDRRLSQEKIYLDALHFKSRLYVGLFYSYFKDCLVRDAKILHRQTGGCRLGSMLARWFLLLMCGLFPAQALARLSPPLDTSSPYATMQSFEQEIQNIESLFETYRLQPSSRNEQRLRAAVRRAADQLLDMRHVPPATHPKVGGRSLTELTDILSRLPIILPESIPGAPGHAPGPLPPHWTFPGTEIRIDRVSAPDAPPEFRFSSATIARSSEFHTAVIDQPPLRPRVLTHWREAQIQLAGPMIPPALLDALPASLRRTVLETPVWKIVASSLVILVTMSLGCIWTSLIRRRAAHAVLWRHNARWLSMPLILALLVGSAHYIIDRQINLNGVLSDSETLGMILLLYAAMAWATALVFRLIAEIVIAWPSLLGDSYDVHLLRLMARVTGFLGAAAVLVYGANELGLPALGVVAGLGVGGIAVALASQSTIENLFGGVSIFADRPFRIGDRIRVDTLHGTVEAIGPRSTRIRTADGSLTTVPNADIAKAHVNNLSMRDRFLFDQHVYLPPDAKAGQLRTLLSTLRLLLERHPLILKSEGLPRVRLVSLAPEGGRIHILANLAAADEEVFLQTQEALLISIGELLDRNHVQAGDASQDSGEIVPQG